MSFLQRIQLFSAIFMLCTFVVMHQTHAQIVVSTTTITVSICGDSLINAGEECDVVGETGAYSTTIVGRQCGIDCLYGPYCGDGILQTLYDEECDDGNNTSNDFCAADCTAETADNGGGSTGGGGSSSRVVPMKKWVIRRCRFKDELFQMQRSIF
jgi:cysteine-rich repeat protein